ncbi:MAG: hypothetical protein KDB65_13730 [Calditrichaeota bacterium]|nr:hypothetical protein [Calditrichota bacterium]
MDASPHDLYAATSGGVLVYDLDRARWADPEVMGYGSFEAIPIDDAVLIKFDEKFNYVWVATRQNLLRWSLGLDRWEFAVKNVWPVGERPVNIGLNETSIFVETIPENIFENTFAAGSPIPDPLWMGYIRRFSGDRFTGNLMSQIKPWDEDPSIVWRGLRSKVKLRDSDYPPGVLGVEPAGLPMVFAPKPYSWLADGSLLDFKNRDYPITDWLIDQRNTFWSTHWGAGVMRTELRGLRGEEMLAGPEGNDIRVFMPLDRELWMGGANEGDFMGISVMEDYGDDWRVYDRRSDAQIRSTNVSDMVFIVDHVWIATADGLLSYFPKKRTWKRYDVQDGLPSQRVTALAAQGETLWIGTDDGLAVMNTQTNSIDRVANTTFELAGVTDLVAQDSVVWVATGLGLYSVNPDSRDVTSLEMGPGLVANEVTGLSVFGNTLWAATRDGIMRRSESGETKSWLAATWMKKSEPTCITASDPYIWVGTDGGLFRFEPDREAWEHYTRRDGLVNDRVLTVREDRGDLWIGTTDGISRFYYSRPGKPR